MRISRKIQLVYAESAAESVRDSGCKLCRFTSLYYAYVDKNIQRGCQKFVCISKGKKMMLLFAYKNFFFDCSLGMIDFGRFRCKENRARCRRPILRDARLESSAYNTYNTEADSIRQEGQESSRECRWRLDHNLEQQQGQTRKVGTRNDYNEKSWLSKFQCQPIIKAGKRDITRVH